MKKTLLTIVLAVVMIATSAIYVDASSNTLSNDLYSKLSAYGMTSADKVKIDRYLADNPTTDEQANAILAKADEAVAIMQASGKTNEDKNKIKAIAQEAGSVIGLTVSFKADGVEIYKGSKLIEKITTTGSKLAYTGNTVNFVIIGSSVVAMALVLIFVARNRFNKVGA